MHSGRVPVDVDIAGAKNLWLVVSDGGDGYFCDWADWIDPKLIRADGSSINLTDLKWKSATTGYGQIGLNKNIKGGALQIEKRRFTNGIGTHAPSIIEFELPENFARFMAKVGPDNGGVEQNCGTSIEFSVFTEKPPDSLGRAASDRQAAERAYGFAAAQEFLNTTTIAEGLEATVFAAEPLLRNPTDIDIDAHGRVWVCEGVNYRSSFQQWGTLDPKGDRIVILEDTNGDGAADSGKTFYQGTNINSALGICVLGNKAIVSCSPNVLVLTDTNGDDRADKEEILFSGIGGVDHDHGVHAFIFGPDGKLYFNFGNESGQLKDKNGNPIKDLHGKIISRENFRQGMTFRCNPDGSAVEVLGQNFRNPYEVALDSFGTIWQGDNDDDGNRSVRINYLMEHGNFGYLDETTGAGWAQKRTNIEEETARRHWHQNDPGVVPNLLITGAGAPTGITFYEGKLLPEIFQNQIIHCDAGPRVVRSYTVKPDGAGYTAAITNILSSSDAWFRPSDVCVASDGSIYVSDWHDSGVGGHNMADRNLDKMRGRIYRIAPKGNKPTLPRLDFTTIAGSVAALKSPNLATRYLGWEELKALGELAEMDLLKVWNDDDQRMRARGLQLLARIEGKGKKYVEQALQDRNSDIRISGLRIARELSLDLVPYLKTLAKDRSAQVRRECALALHNNSSSEAPNIWAELAAQHDDKDRWYLEALGIGADKQHDRFFAAWLKRVNGSWNTPAGRDIVWRSRSSETPKYLAQLIVDPNTKEKERAKYFRAFDFVSGAEKEKALVGLLELTTP